MKCYFVKKDRKKYIEETDVQKNKEANLKLTQILKNNKKLIPNRYLKNWNEVKLFHPAGDVTKADAIILNLEDGAYSLRNKINHLTGKEWTKFTKSWFIFNAIQSDLKEEKTILDKFNLNPAEHPATFSPTMIDNFIQFFTKPKELVFDPFCGIGTTLVACDRSNRKGLGIELNKKYTDISKFRTKQKIINGDSSQLKTIFKKEKIKNIDFTITSPPYWNVLNRSTGNFEKKRKEKRYDIRYSNESIDFGNINVYEDFIESLYLLYKDLNPFLRKNAYIVIIVKNLKKSGVNYPLAWDLAKRLSDIFTFKDEKIWCQDKMPLSPFGYPFSWTSNIHHHYCLIFRKEK